MTSSEQGNDGDGGDEGGERAEFCASCGIHFGWLGALSSMMLHNGVSKAEGIECMKLQWGINDEALSGQIQGNQYGVRYSHAIAIAKGSIKQGRRRAGKAPLNDVFTTSSRCQLEGARYEYEWISPSRSSST